MDLTEWAPFFSTLAATTATLAGLLFGALSLRLPTLARAEQALSKRLALQIFTAYLYALIVSISLLVPQTGARALAVLVGVLGVLGLLDVVRFTRLLRRVAPRALARRYFMSRIAWSVGECVGFLAVGGALARGMGSALHWLAVILIVMTVGATARVWDLIFRLPELAMTPD